MSVDAVQLPADVWRLIILQLPLGDVFAFNIACKKFRCILEYEFFRL